MDRLKNAQRITELSCINVYQGHRFLLSCLIDFLFLL
uniref:Uncharacterized protein n=1 Tax=Rhizophora mucronata TaxID=61149 RepID=A0A2P2NDB8_RHIMU